MFKEIRIIPMLLHEHSSSISRFAIPDGDGMVYGGQWEEDVIIPARGESHDEKTGLC
jgi:hypothetical protein